MKDITVCIVDDISELRQALEEIVSSADGYKCLGTMSNAAEAIAKIPILNPDVVLMGYKPRGK
jgi:chemotaxis response regulator CheB